MIVIKNFSSRSLQDYKHELERGGRFVVFEYCISAILFTSKHSSAIYLIRGSENGAFKALRFTMITLLFGWWGIPWGPVYTIQALTTNLKGGRDVTPEVMDDIEKQLNPRSQYF
ncbi:MAG: hypothetical protein AAFN93_01080 [Bacteroidota bacterium]